MRHPRPALVALAFLAACDNQPKYEGAFDLPGPVAVLQPEAGGPFREPVGYVASEGDGQIGLLALKQGRFLTDRPEVAFVRSAWLATGRARRITGLAPFATGADRVDVFVADRAFDTILRVPHVVGLDADGVPERAAVEVDTPSFDDADASGDAPTLAELRAAPGWATTESWTVARVGGRWEVRGSRSGLLDPLVTPGEPWEGPGGILAFTLEGDATDGDRFTFDTRTGVEELPAGGTPLHFKLAPDSSRAAVVLAHPDASLSMAWFDPLTFSLEDAALPEGARPGRPTWAADASALFVADAAGFWRWDVAEKSWAFTATPWPVLDLAPLLGEGADLIYLARADAHEVWVYDLDAGAYIDVNEATEGVDGMRFLSPIRGVEAVPYAVDWPQLDEAGEPLSGRNVAVSLNNGQTFFMEEGTGCLVRDANGPRTDAASLVNGSDFSSTVPVGTPSPPTLEVNASNARHVQVNPCGGIAHGEVWTLTWRENLQAWEARGSVSGLQQALVYEDVRYLSDTGAISLLLRSGGTPNTEGWTFRFTVLQGVSVGDGNNDVLPDREVSIVQPGDPVYFSYLAGPEGEQTLRHYLLLSSQGSDLAARVNPGTGAVEAAWF